MKSRKTICYVAGKSGGHIIPCLTLAREERSKDPNIRTIFFSTDDQLDKSIIEKSSDITDHITLPLKNCTYRNGLQALRLIYNTIRSCFKLLYYFICHRPNAVIATGGFITVPATYCARLLGIPVILYELNAVPGKAIALAARSADEVRICFTQTERLLPGANCMKVSYPIRFFGESVQMSQLKALSQLNLSHTRKTITILGGSQGSDELNNLIQKFLYQHPTLHKHIQIIHQTGNHNLQKLQSFYSDLAVPSITFSFCDNLAPHYAAADIIICRSGAGTLFEVLFFGKTCITVPLITNQNSHQVDNALAMSDRYDELFKAFILRKEPGEEDALFKYLNEKLSPSIRCTEQSLPALKEQQAI